MSPARPDFSSMLKSKPWVALLLAVGGLVTGVLVAHLLDHDMPRSFKLVLVGVVGAAGVALTFIHWRSLDEAAREAHKAAWYWGGTAGALVFAFIIGLLLAPGAPFAVPTLYDRTDPAAYVATGAALMFTFQILGYLVAWAWWWLSRR